MPRPTNIALPIDARTDSNRDAIDDQFFQFLGLRALPEGKPDDLCKFFSKDAFTKSVANPYGNPPESLMAVIELPTTVLTNKMSTMNETIAWLNPFMIFIDRHYELGMALIRERPRIFAAKGKGRLRMYKKSIACKKLLHILILLLVLIAVFFYVSVYFFSHETTLTLSLSNAMELIPPCAITLLVNFVVLVSFHSARPKKHKRGILRYLRQVGTPLVEEVMISYSWQQGVLQDTRCIAKALIQSGIGVWIDVLKLTSGDSTTRTTRTVASHARFVLVVLTSKYVKSQNCFIELYEALRAKSDPRSRLIVYRPDEKVYGAPFDAEASAMADALADQLGSMNIPVLRTVAELVHFLNRRVIYSVDQSHFIWWLDNVGSSVKVPENLIVPDPKSTISLKKFNFKLLCPPTFKSHGAVYRWRNEVPFRFEGWKIRLLQRIKVSNMWISCDLREMGQNASAFPWKPFVLLLLLPVPLLDLFFWKGTRLLEGQDKLISIILFGLSFGLEVVLGMTDVGFYLDRRNNIHPCLYSLLATNNFNISVRAPNTWVSGIFPPWSRAEEAPRIPLRRRCGFFRIKRTNEELPSYASSTSLRNSKVAPEPTPTIAEERKLYVAIEDFNTDHPVANNLKLFLDGIGFSHPPRDKSLIVVHVILFGGGLCGDKDEDSQSKEIVRQVKAFGEYLRKNSISVEDCVLAASHAEKWDMKVPGLFEATIPNLKPGGPIPMGTFMILLSEVLGKSFGEEVLLQTDNTSKPKELPQHIADQFSLHTLEQGQEITANESRVFDVQFRTSLLERLSQPSTPSQGFSVSGMRARVIGSQFSVVVVGGKSIGKTALVNSVFSHESVLLPTSSANMICNPAAFAALVDTPGFMRGGHQNQSFSPSDLIQLVQAAKDPSDSTHLIHIDMVWYLIDSLQPEDAAALKTLVEMEIPLIILIAKADCMTLDAVDLLRQQIHTLLEPAEENEQNEAVRSENVDDVDRLFKALELDASIRGWDIVELRNPPQQIAPACEDCGFDAVLKPVAFPSSANKSVDRMVWYCKNPTCIFSKDLYLKLQDHRSISSSLKVLSASVNSLLGNVPARRFQIAQLLSITPKKVLAAKIVTAATLAAAGIGAAPIPFADAPLLLATQYTMILSICRVFGVKALGLNDVMFYVSILAASPFPFLGIAAAGAAKVLPGVGSVGAAMVEAPIAAGLTMAMGVAVIKTCADLHALRVRGAGGKDGKNPEFRFDKSVQLLVQESFGKSVAWIKSAFVGGTLDEKAVGEHILNFVDGVDPPELVFDQGNLDWTNGVSNTSVDVNQVKSELAEGHADNTKVAHVFLSSTALLTK
ncbi:hypothetical protein CcCBS67573_g06649 [Chytriomyces confervae]|uniref:TIR domain-containing protein n=1 Tax=Chytriomyces confervae TaxID=246404 RepID=A0A507F1X9_9FUNG|nr:hypothetical protein CcCBS67573_g06649 [Chytriomyces confervae]